MVRFNVRALALLLLLAAPAARAQLWSGPSAVEVRAEDQKGHDLVGAHVLLVYSSQIPKDGPPAVETDARGHATVGGLADGAWHVEVSHDGFMTYIVDIHVRQGGRPEIGDATQYRVPGGGTNLMKVRISRGNPSAAAPARTVAPVRPAVTSPAPAPAVPIPTPTPAPVAAAPAPEPPPAPPAPVTPKPTPPPAPVTQPATPPPAPVVPAPAPTPHPAAPPEDSVRLRTTKDRTCVECQPGESALSVERVIPPGGGEGCGGNIAARLKEGYVPAGLPAGCNVLRIALPAGARYTAYRYEVLQDGKDSLDCPTAQDCPNHLGRWPMDPVLLRGPQGTIVLAPFEGGSADRERRAVLTVYFTTGKMGKKP
jgi:hypothetical protein